MRQTYDNKLTRCVIGAGVQRWMAHPGGTKDRDVIALLADEDFK